MAPKADALATRSDQHHRPRLSTDAARRAPGAGRRAVHGENVQVVASPQQIILAAEITQSANDSAQLEPMIHHALGALGAAGISAELEGVLADGGYWNSPQIARLRQKATQPIVPNPIPHAHRTAQPLTTPGRRGPPR